MAIVTLEVSPELEQQLRAEAAKQALDPSLYLLNTLQEHLQPNSNQFHLYQNRIRTDTKDQRRLI